MLIELFVENNLVVVPKNRAQKALHVWNKTTVWKLSEQWIEWVTPGEAVKVEYTETVWLKIIQGLTGI